jgi:hypothetical protein
MGGGVAPTICGWPLPVKLNGNLFTLADLGFLLRTVNMKCLTCRCGKTYTITYIRSVLRGPSVIARGGGRWITYLYRILRSIWRFAVPSVGSLFDGRHKLRFILAPRILSHLRVKMRMTGRYTSDI